MKKKKRLCDLAGNTRGYASKPQKNNLLTFLHPNIDRCTRDHMTESKYSERPPLSLTNLAQTVLS